jgi:hypothetical protein
MQDQKPMPSSRIVYGDQRPSDSFLTAYCKDLTISCLVKSTIKGGKKDHIMDL